MPSLAFSDATSSWPRRLGKLVAAVPEGRTALTSKSTRPHPAPSPTNVIDNKVEDFRTVALVDTSAAVSVIKADICRALDNVTTPCKDCRSVPQARKILSQWPLARLLYFIELIVLPAYSHDVLLGWDFLSRHNAGIDFARPGVEFSFCDALFDDSKSAPPTKLAMATDTDIPAYSSVCVPMRCVSPTDATVLFTPSYVFLHRNCFPLPSAVLTLSAGTGNMFVTNVSSAQCTFLEEETLGNLEYRDPGRVIDIPDRIPQVQVDGLDPCPPGPAPSTDVFLACVDGGLDPTLHLTT